MDEMAHQLDETSEELRVADEEDAGAARAASTRLLRDRSAERLAGVRLMAALPVAVVETDPAGAAARTRPRPRSSRSTSGRLRGKPLAVMVESADRRALRSALARVVTGGGTERLAVFLTSRRHGALRGGDRRDRRQGPAGRSGRPRRAGRDPARDAPAARFVIVPPELGTLWSRRRAGRGGGLLFRAVRDRRRPRESVLSRTAELAVSSIGPAVASGITVGSPARIRAIRVERRRTGAERPRRPVRRRPPAPSWTRSAGSRSRRRHCPRQLASTERSTRSPSSTTRSASHAGRVAGRVVRVRWWDRRRPPRRPPVPGGRGSTRGTGRPRRRSGARRCRRTRRRGRGARG